MSLLKKSSYLLLTTTILVVISLVSISSASAVERMSKEAWHDKLMQQQLEQQQAAPPKQEVQPQVVQQPQVVEDGPSWTLKLFKILINGLYIIGLLALLAFAYFHINTKWTEEVGTDSNSRAINYFGLGEIILLVAVAMPAFDFYYGNDKIIEWGATFLMLFTAIGYLIFGFIVVLLYPKICSRVSYDANRMIIIVPGIAKNADSIFDYLNPRYLLKIVHRDIIPIDSIRGLSSHAEIERTSTESTLYSGSNRPRKITRVSHKITHVLELSTTKGVWSLRFTSSAKQSEANALIISVADLHNVF